MKKYISTSSPIADIGGGGGVFYKLIVEEFPRASNLDAVISELEVCIVISKYTGFQAQKSQSNTSRVDITLRC